MPWEPQLGAVPGQRTRFRVWAPGKRIELVLNPGPNEAVVPMERESEYVVLEHEAPAGTPYKYRVDGNGPFPDPCSRFQPEGVHGVSEVVDPSAFAWTDDAFVPPDPAGVVVYEMHVGTFTPEGTFDAAAEKLSRLRDLGVTVVEVMPIAAFPGERNWGYDGVALFAPAAPYGGPEGFRRFVDAAHANGLAVMLDVVYNHFGPDGNYTGVYSPNYLTSRHQTPWGDAVNFDSPGSEHVRRFFLENLLHWRHEYHVDGFRFDATHAIFDDSPTHILAELHQGVTGHCDTCSKAIFFAESHENDVRYLRPEDEAGFGFDGVWADDFHHIVRNLLRRERDGYLGYYEGTATALYECIERGWYFEGQAYGPGGESRGTMARQQPWRQFVYCIQNHDQVGNRAFGDRLNASAGRDEVLAATALLLLLPQTPMLFQGQEFGATTPFQYFTDHVDRQLAEAVSAGRRQEFAHFRAFADEHIREQIPDPQDERTFLRSKLDWDQAEGLGRLIEDYHRALLELRAHDTVLCASRQGRPSICGQDRGRALLVTVEAGESCRWIGVNFGDAPVSFMLGQLEARVLLHSQEPRFGGNGEEPSVERGCLHLPAHSAALLAPPPEPE